MIIKETTKALIERIKVRGDLIILEVPKLGKTEKFGSLELHKTEEQIARENNEFSSRNRLYKVIAVGHLVSDFRVGDECFIMPHALTAFLDGNERDLIYCRESDIVGSLQKEPFDFSIPLPIVYQVNEKEALGIAQGKSYLEIRNEGE